MRTDKLYILGTSHPLQCGSDECSPTKVDAFRAELQRIFKAHNIRCVAEEMNAEGLLQHTVDSTIAQQLASSLDIQHHNVELTSEERALVSLDQSAIVNVLSRIPSKDGGTKLSNGFDRTLSEVRERCWVARILAKQQWPTLFICGAEHSKNVAKLWRRFGLTVVVLHSDYEP
jgi:hypothetical protein